MKMFGQLALDLKKASQDILWNLAEAERMTGREALKKAIQYSSGDHTLAALAAIGHPYAKRHGAPRLDPSVINTQTGVFRAAWQFYDLGYNGNAHTVQVQNYSMVAQYLRYGTRFMFARPIDQRVVSELAQIRVNNISKAVSKSFNT